MSQPAPISSHPGGGSAGRLQPINAPNSGGNTSSTRLQGPSSASTSTTSSKPAESFSGSNLIKGRWKVLKKIGAGAFGEIYSAKNVVSGELVAFKVERVDSKKQVLKLEVAVLKKLQGCAQVCRFVTCGRYNEYNYMVMELLGDNLSELRRRQPDGRFSMATTLRLGQQMLQSLESVHDLGYLHRDVKPSNFAMGLGGMKRGTAYLIDYGLARRYLLSSGEVRPARESTGFRGTARYASINSHLSKDLGRRDDLWSVFYVLVEFAQGYLPWRKLKDKDQIGEMKIKFNTPELVKDLPPIFLTFMKHLKSLSYEDRPDYQYLQNLMSELYQSLNYDQNTPYDWELPPSTQNIRNTSSSNSPYQTSNLDVEYSRARDTEMSTSQFPGSHLVPGLAGRPDSRYDDGRDPFALSPSRSLGRRRKSSGTASVIVESSEGGEDANDGSWNRSDNPHDAKANRKSLALSQSLPADGNNISIQIVDSPENGPDRANGSGVSSSSTGPAAPSSGHKAPKEPREKKDRKGCHACVIQ
eukprot:TRINITY_DN2395_c0_g1_i1.p1 TRINITY_DN2395_c0_g1~~TRINITY_DN2395_c0_g1_i1.p1  ORF type:complete len:527 (-),score=92.01 TRINITY_DN2395_c0_g1_i1:158-1738(-)